MWYIYICEDYAQEFGIAFNGDKSQLLVFRGCDYKVVTKSQIFVNNVIPVQDNKAIHLGHSLNTNDEDSIVSV